MKRRARRLWIRLITMIHRSLKALVGNLISANRELFWSASISSRITTVILVAIDHQINYNWYNEPSAVSLFKSLKLRHAWLNLWDKHMTTGRINQVTCVGLVLVKELSPNKSNLSEGSVIKLQVRLKSKPVSIPNISSRHEAAIPTTSVLQE